MKALKEALKGGKIIGVFQPGPFANQAATSGTVALEGPHYPEPHRWYASAIIKDSQVQSIK